MGTSDAFPLDNPAWSALTTRQAHLGQGNRLAFRYLPDVAPFAAVADATLEAFQELRQLLEPDGQALLQTPTPLPALEGMWSERLGSILQMEATGDPGDARQDDVVRLGAGNSEEMLELVQKTKPGPFGKRTHETGNYIGIRSEGRLIAMAGERMRLDAYVEISAVCVDPAYRGKGLAGRLMNVLRREILQRGETPFLHVFDNNDSAVDLYRRLGFETRQTFLLYRVGCSGLASRE